MYYVRVQPLKGRNDFYKLAVLLNERGYEDRVEYFQGDNDVLPHLRFLDKEDALAYCLTYGCSMSSNMPMLGKPVNQNN